MRTCLSKDPREAQLRQLPFPFSHERSRKLHFQRCFCMCGEAKSSLQLGACPVANYRSLDCRSLVAVIWQRNENPKSRSNRPEMSKNEGGRIRMALYQPDIPQNAGTILRLAACMGVGVDVIGPTGFDMTDRALRRAGLDYLQSADLTRYLSMSEFEMAREQGNMGRLVLLTTNAKTPYTDFAFAGDDTLLLGRESAGVPLDVHEMADARLVIPMRVGDALLEYRRGGGDGIGGGLAPVGRISSPVSRRHFYKKVEKRR